MSQVPPLVGIVAVLVAALALRRAVEFAGWGAGARTSARAGLAAGATGGVLLATNMLEVWQAKYPSTEISAQMLFVGALFGVVVALATGWRAAAGAAGLLVGVGFLDRADSLIYLLLAAGAGAALLATGRWDARATWFAGGLAVVLPHAFWQAYSPSAALHYSRDNSVPGLRTVVAVLVVVLLFGRLLRPVGRWAAGVLTRRRPQSVAGAVVTASAGALLLLGFLRPWLFGQDRAVLGGRYTRTYDEQILARLSWFLTWPAFALLLLGVAVVALRRWSAPLWALTLPLLAIFPVYGVHARNSTRLMWWSRRYVPSVLPLVLLLAAAALTAVAVLAPPALRRWWPRLPARPATAVATTLAVAATAALTGVYGGQSWPLRSHSEFGGSFEISQEIADVAGSQQGVFLWQRSPACCLYAQSLFGAALWLERDQISAILPRDPQQVAGYLMAFRRGFPGQPEFVVWHGQQPPGLPGVRLEPVKRFQTALVYWEETELRRPSSATTVSVDFVVYRVVPSAVPGVGT